MFDNVVFHSNLVSDILIMKFSTKNYLLSNIILNIYVQFIWFLTVRWLACISECSSRIFRPFLCQSVSPQKGCARPFSKDSIIIELRHPTVRSFKKRLSDSCKWHFMCPWSNPILYDELIRCCWLYNPNSRLSYFLSSFHRCFTLHL